MAMGFEQRQRLAGQAQVEQRAVGAAAPEHFGVEGLGEADRPARLRRLAGAQVRQYFVVGQDAFDQRLDRAAAGFAAVQPRLDDARVVEDQQIAGVEQRRQVAEHAVGRRRAAAVEQARCAALGRRALCDQLRWQGEIEIGDGVVAWRSGFTGLI